MSKPGFLFIVLLCAILGSSAHFLGGTIKWMPVNDTIKFTYRLAWERGTGPCGPTCTEADIGRTANISSPTINALKWQCTSGCGAGPVIIGDVNYIITSVSRNPSRWEQGEGFFLYKHTGPGLLSVALKNFTWVPPVNSAEPSFGFIETIVDLSIRGDTGKPNGSPYVSLPSVIGLQYNCTTVVKIPVDDPDGDVTRCRWAESHECGEGCTNVPPNTIELDRVACTLTASAHALTSYVPNRNYRLALIVEDFPEYVLDFGGRNLTRGNRMSAIPIQFSVKVINILESCETTRHRLKFVPPNIRHRVSFGGMEKNYSRLLRVPIYLASDDTETEFMASVPAWTAITNRSDNFNRPNVTTFELEMQPKIPDQAGDNQFCAWANDKHGITSDPRCAVVMIDDEDLCRITCPNHGRCLNLYHRERCFCPLGFKPPDCFQEVTCSDFPCENNSTCLNTGKNYSCICLPGFTGADCEYEVNECASNPCQNNGSCLHLRNGFHCPCPAFITGPTCEEGHGTIVVVVNARVPSKVD